jgi:peptidoglycan hydrolase CwlO-like protein
MKLRINEWMKLTKSEIVQKAMEIEDTIMYFKKEKENAVSEIASKNKKIRTLTDDISLYKDEVVRLNEDIKIMNRELLDSRMTINEMVRHILD